MIYKNNDWTGTGFLQKGPKNERFFRLGEISKIYYPSNMDIAPTFKVKLNLSKKTNEYYQNIYTIVDWMIDMGGFSKACFYGGMGIAMVSALRLY